VNAGSQQRSPLCVWAPDGSDRLAGGPF